MAAGIVGVVPNGPGTVQPTPPNEFRARFARSLVVPSPFSRAYPEAVAAAAAAAAVASSANGAPGPGADAIDPHLAGPAGSVQGKK